MCHFTDFFQSFDWGMLKGKSHKILDLTNEYGNCDSCGKSCGNGIWNEADQASHPQKSHNKQKDSCQNSCHNQPVKAVFRSNPCHDRCKCGGGACNLNLTSSQKRDDKTSCNGGVKPLLRCNTAC